MTNLDSYEKSLPPEGTDEKPPIFRKWRHWYIAILVELVLLIVLFRVITVVFE